MPLPKSCSMAARATEAYAEAWSVVLYECWGVKPPRDEPLPPLVQLLPFIRQLLTCCACAGLLEEAMISLSCGHCYCAKCQLGTPLLKIQCRQCKERTGLVSENQIRLVVKCYRHMCHVLADYIAGNPSAKLHKGEFVLAKGKEIPVGFNPVTEILSEVVNGVKVSRTVLFVLPPQKYLNPKPPPDPPTLKKEQTPSSVGNHTQSLPGPSSASIVENNTLSQDEEGPIDVTGTAPSPLLSRSARQSHTKGKRRDGEAVEDVKGKSRLGHSNQATLPLSRKWKRAKIVQIPSVMFHGSVDFVSSRPASHRGAMKLFFSLKLLRLKQATLPRAEDTPEVTDDCIDHQFISSTSFVYTLSQDLPSAALLPPPHRPHSSCLPNFAQVLRPKLPDPTKLPTTGKKTPRGVPLRSRTALTPRAKYKLLRRKYKSPYLSNPHTSQPRKTKHSAHDDTPPPAKLSVALCSSEDLSPTVPTPVKKKKRSPMTPGNWRCRCGTNNPQTFDRICARGKCPCFVKSISCKNCLCRHCKNPFNISLGL